MSIKELQLHNINWTFLNNECQYKGLAETGYLLYLYRYNETFNVYIEPQENYYSINIYRGVNLVALYSVELNKNLYKTIKAGF